MLNLTNLAAILATVSAITGTHAIALPEQQEAAHDYTFHVKLIRYPTTDCTGVNFYGVDGM